MADHYDTPATSVQAIRIDPDNRFLLREPTRDFLNVKNAVGDTVERIVTALHRTSPAGMKGDPVKHNGDYAALTKQVRERFKPDDLELSCRVFQAAFNAPPSGPAHELVAAYDGNDRAVLVSESYGLLNTYKDKNFRDLYNDESATDERAMPAEFRALLDQADADKATRLRAARHFRALSHVWVMDDVVRAVKKILRLSKGIMPSYEWVGRSLATGRYVHSDALLLDGPASAQEGRGQVRSMMDLHDAIEAWSRKTGRPYWEYVFPKAAFQDAVGDAFNSVQGVKRFRGAIEKGIAEIPKDAQSDLLSFFIPLQQVATVGDLLWNKSRILQAVVGADGVFDKANPALCQYLGYGTKELNDMKKNADMALLADAASRSAFAEAIESLRHGEGHRWADYRLKTKDGRIVGATGHAFGLGDGKVYAQWKMDPESYGMAA